MKLPDNQRDTLYTFLRCYVNLGSSKMNSKFDNIIEPLKNNVMGLLEMVKIMDREEAVRKTSMSIAKRMVKLGLSSTTIQKSTGLEARIIKNMQQRLSVSRSAR